MPQAGHRPRAAARDATEGLLSPSPACVSRESRGHPDRLDLRVLGGSRGHQGPRAELSRDPW